MSEEDTWSGHCFARLMRDKPTELAIDSETTGLTWKDTAFGVSFAWYRGDKLESGYIDMRHHNDLWEDARLWIKSSKPKLILHNAKFDFHKLNMYPNDFEDTCLMVYLLNEHYPKKLKILAQKILKESTDGDAVVKKTRQQLKLKREDGYDKLPLSVVAPYAIKDAEYTLRLYHRLKDKIEAEEELAEVYALERQLLLCVAGTELRGMAVDIDYAKKMVIELGDKIIAVQRKMSDIIGKPIGRNEPFKVRDGEYKNGRPKYRKEYPGEFNPDSPPQLVAYFNSVGITLTSTKDNVLETLSHPLAPLLKKWRSLKKDRNTYFKPIVDESVWDEEYQCWVLHPNFNLTETKTYRSSSSKVKE